MSSPAEDNRAGDGAWQTLISAGQRLLSRRSLTWLSAGVVGIVSHQELARQQLHTLASPIWLFLFTALCWFTPRHPAAWAILSTLGIWVHYQFLDSAVDPRAMVWFVTAVIGLVIFRHELAIPRGRAIAVGRLITTAIMCFYSYGDYYASAAVALLAGVWCIIYGQYILEVDDDVPKVATTTANESP